MLDFKSRVEAVGQLALSAVFLGFVYPKCELFELAAVVGNHDEHFRLNAGRTLHLVLTSVYKLEPVDDLSFFEPNRVNLHESPVVYLDAHQEVGFVRCTVGQENECFQIAELGHLADFSCWLENGYEGSCWEDLERFWCVRLF